MEEMKKNQYPELECKSRMIFSEVDFLMVGFLLYYCKLLMTVWLRFCTVTAVYLDNSK